jgi:hypothetical protein
LEGYTAVIGFPQVHSELEKWDFTGPARLYEKAGFEEVSRYENKIVMRKALSQ